MLDKLRDEWQWSLIFIITQICVLSFYYRDIETKFFPVVEDFRVAHVVKYEEDGITLYVAFEKVRDCDYKGIRAIHPSGAFVRIEFQDSNGINYHSRHTGKNKAGPWKLYNENWHNIQIEVLHKCDPFGLTRSVIQKIKA